MKKISINFVVLCCVVLCCVVLSCSFVSEFAKGEGLKELYLWFRVHNNSGQKMDLKKHEDFMRDYFNSQLPLRLGSQVVLNVLFREKTTPSIESGTAFTDAYRSPIVYVLIKADQCLSNRIVIKVFVPNQKHIMVNSYFCERDRISACFKEKLKPILELVVKSANESMHVRNAHTQKET
jgi:hypothetical protein